MRQKTGAAILYAIVRIFEVSAAFTAKGVQRAIAEQTVKVFRICSLMAGEILTFFIAEK